MKNKKLGNLILVLLVVVIFGYCYYAFYLKNEVQQISALKTQISKKEASLNDLNVRKSTINQELAVAKLPDTKLDEAILDEFDKKEAIKFFYYFVKERGVKVDKITFNDKDKGNKEYRTITVNFKASGTSDEIRSFIKAIENNKRKFVIKQVNINESAGLINATMTLEMYSLS